MRRSLALIVGLVGCSSTTTTKTPPQPGEIIGSVEISADVPATGCIVLLEGTPLGGHCDETGAFDIRRVPPGRWDLRIITDGGATALPAKRVAAGSNPGLVSDLGAVRLAQPGSVGGHILNPGMTDLSLAIVAVPEIGAVTAPNDNKGFLLENVSPGEHDVVLITDAGTVIHKNVNVLPQKTTIGADLDVGSIVPNMVSVLGRATRVGAADGAHGGITVELVEDLNGMAVDKASTAADGSFTLTAKYGTYIVRASDGANPIKAIIPSVVVRGSSDVQLTSALAIHPQHGDLNGNGIPDDKDPDIDGDGVPNAMDAFPYDPSEWKDTDSDGVGDRADLRSMGGTGIDTHNPTPDTDGDGILDFEDNCPKDPNPDQWDPDKDGVGTVKDASGAATNKCDNCPFVPNPDQADSVGNGIGDACRFCKQNSDCGAGKICQFGQCVDCISTAECGDLVCDVTAGKCVACDATHLCAGTTHCGAMGRCVACLQSSDCPTGNACVLNQCFPQCVNDASCLTGQFCVMGACAQCRTTADCTGTQYCDNGLCRNQCLTSSDCSGGRTCDPATHTCVLPCNGMCMNGQTCLGGVCRSICNLTQPCPTGQVCSSQGVCGPECTILTMAVDCAAKPFTTCVGGMCVASGSCALDTDCPTSQICSVAIGSTTGSCVPRPTTLDSNGKYTCATACDCRTSEICVSGECLADPLGKPTRFLAASGAPSADGMTPATATNALSSIATAVATDVIAVKAQDTLTVTAPQAITASSVTLAGGYVVCATNRWVRDDLFMSTLNNTSTSGKGVLAINGTPTVPLDTVTLRNLTLGAADNTTYPNYHIVDASDAPHLTLDNVVFNFVPNTTSGSHVGVSCTDCANVSWTAISTPGVVETTGNSLYLAEMYGSSGTIASTHAGPVSSSTLQVVRVINASGSVTITGTTSDAYTTSTNGATIATELIHVENAPNGTVTISGSQLHFTAANYGNFHAIHSKSVANVSITNNVIDGSTITATTANPTEEGIYVEDSNGLVDKNTMTMPQFYGGSNYLYGVHLLGPNGGVTVSNTTASGGIGSNVYLIYLHNLLTGPALLQNNTMSSSGCLNHCDGFYVEQTNFSNADSFIMTDSTFRVGGIVNGSSPTLYGFDVESSNGRIERNKFYLGANNFAGNYVSASTLELYDNYVYIGVTLSSAYGLEIGNTSNVAAVGNTLDPGGAPSGGTSYGIWCNSAGTLSFVSNLVSGGRAQYHFMAFNYGTNCLNPSQAASKNNYFWYSGVGPQQSGEAAYAITGGSSSTATLNNNLVDTAPSNGCYPATEVQPDYHIDPASKCINAGLTDVRRDGTAIDKDVDGAPRTLGSAPDIGCSEKM
jgi:hypothetical protein